MYVVNKLWEGVAIVTEFIKKNFVLANPGEMFSQEHRRLKIVIGLKNTSFQQSKKCCFIYKPNATTNSCY